MPAIPGAGAPHTARCPRVCQAWVQKRALHADEELLGVVGLGRGLIRCCAGSFRNDRLLFSFDLPRAEEGELRGWPVRPRLGV